MYLAGHLTAGKVEVSLYTVWNLTDFVPVPQGKLNTFGTVGIQILFRQGSSKCIGQLAASGSQQPISVTTIDIKCEVQQAIPQGYIHTKVISTCRNPGQVLINKCRSQYSIGLCTINELVPLWSHCKAFYELEFITGINTGLSIAGS